MSPQQEMPPPNPASRMAEGAHAHGYFLRTHSSRAGMTLVELLVAVTIVAVLAALAASIWPRVSQSVDRKTATHQLRQIGTALHRFAADHNGWAPGPMWPGQIPIIDMDRAGRLALQLAPYLEIEEPATGMWVSQLVPPAFPKQLDLSKVADPRTYVLNMAVRTSAGETINPWGSLTGSAVRSPLLMAQAPAMAWALSDADRLHPRVRNAVWRDSTPARPIHGERRMALLFGGSVLLLEADELD